MRKEDLPLINRDLSWLSFNDRVLQEANDPTVPLLERLKFLGIVSSNRDEFFRVRVATIRRMIRMGKKGALLLGEDPEALLEKVNRTIVKQQEAFDDSYLELLRELELHGIFIINEKQLTADQGEFVRSYFRNQVQPALVPILVDGRNPFPYLRDHSIYFMIIMQKKLGKARHALVEIPTDTVPRFLVLPHDNKYVILLDDVIRYCLDDLFFHFDYDSITAYTVKMTRDAEIDIEQDVTKSLVKKVAEGVKRRKRGIPTRLVHDEKMPKDLVEFLTRKIAFSKGDKPIPGGRYHNFVDFIRFPSLDRKELKYPSLVPLQHPDIKPRTSILKIIRQKDILLAFPYHDYNQLLDVLREASIDPKVRYIKITLYRVARNSHIINALINAVRNGKEVTAVLELTARFDEENNIRMANRLQDEGVKIIYGVPGLKMHSKLFLIGRLESAKEVMYAHIGTGNFNEDTARVYGDFSLLTSDRKITEEVSRVFQFYTDNYKTGNYKHLIVSPFFTRRRLLSYINKEIENAKAGKTSGMFLKMNSLTDREIIQKLYEASQAGVRIRLIVRGICSLVPGIKGLSDRIEAVSIIDKFLEHARVYIFHNDGDTRFYLASFDLMSRNIDYRSEVAVPVYDKRVQKQIHDIMEIQWSDNTKARFLNAAQDNAYRRLPARVKVRSQEAIYAYLSKQNKPPFSGNK